MENKVISKELLSEVLQEKVITCGINERGVLWQYYFDEHLMDEFINIHELAHKCKEWALSLDEDSEVIDSCMMDMKIKSKLKRMGFAELLHNNCRFTAKTEPEAIFKACQWIKDNK